MPVNVGVPEIVIVPANQEAVTPAGKPVAAPILVAPVVAIVMDGVKTVFTTSVGFVDAANTVLSVHVLKVSSVPYDVLAALVA